MVTRSATGTLREDIRVVRNAQRWTWQGTDVEPRKTEYYPLSALADLEQRKPDASFIADLSERMRKPLAAFDTHFDSMVCPITGGKDSRTIASLLINAGIDVQYFTFGEPSGDDAKIAAQIANKFDLRHSVKPIEHGEVVENWEQSCVRNIRAADGMRSLYLLAGLAKSKPIIADKRDIYLWGACGEVARSFFGNLPFLRPGLTIDDIKNFLKVSGPGDPAGLVRIDALARAKAWQDRYFEYCAGEGIQLIDIPDIYGNHAVDGRRLGNNGRALAATRDTFTPFATRAFLEAAFSVPALQRYTEPLHYGLTRRLAPELHRMPLAKSEWRSQNAMLNLVRMRAKRKWKRFNTRVRKAACKVGRAKPVYFYQDSMFNRLGWFEDKREHILELATDPRAAAIWNFVERDRFEKIMSADTHRSLRSQNLQLLFHIATLAYYETDSEREARWNDQLMSRTRA